MKRRLFPILLLIFSSLAWSEVRSLTILHTNDLHARLLPLEDGKGGFARLATAIRQERSKSSACLYFNAGDLVQGTPVSTIYKGLPIYEIANLFGIDAATLGNHEFDYGWQMIPKFLRTARYPVVAANVADASGQRLTDHPYVILKAGGLRVSVIGALTTDMVNLSTPKTRGPWQTLPIVAAVRREAREVRDQSDLIVLLAHVTLPEEEAILTEIKEVSVTVSGHVHKGLENPLSRDGRVLVRVAAYGVELGRLDLQVDTTKKTVVSWTHKRIPIDSSFAPAQDVAKLVAHWEGEADKVVSSPIGEARREFPRPEVRRLMQRAMAEVMGTDFAWINAGGVRDVLPKGRLLARHVWNIMPFDNRVVMGRFKGRDLPTAVKEGRAIDPQREYSLAVTDFNVATQNSPTGMGSTGLVFPQEGPLLRDLFINWIRKKQVLE
jgi:5'-nucleotidase / UDP-sugar diphosphatase